MPRKTFPYFRLAASALTVALALGCSAPTPAPSNTVPPKLILIIGDGMDDQQITIARNYLVGTNGRLTLDGLPFRGAVQPQGVAEDDPGRPIYVTESANAATAIATGTLTSPGRIATTAQTDQDLTTIMELAQAAGLGTGVVTTSSVTDATTAAFMAHVSRRACQSPAQMVRKEAAGESFADCPADSKRNGGEGSISEQIAESAFDVVLGGGLRYFDQAAEGKPEVTVVDRARGNGFHVVLDLDDLNAASRSRRVLGLFSPDTMPVQLRANNGGEAQRITGHTGQLRVPEPFGCEANPSSDGVPTLAEMTATALDHLDAARGFMLLVESASIDKQSHVRRPCGHIGELGQLDEAAEVAVDYARMHPETLILITADHAHAAQIITGANRLVALEHASPGYVARVLTPEGGIMGINYATSTSRMEVHTGGQVPAFASGPGIDELPRFMTQRDIFDIAIRHLGIPRPY